MNNSRHARTAAAVLLALVLATPMIAQDNDGTGTTNVLMTFRMGTLDGDTKTVVKCYSLIVADGSMGSKLLSGKRVPFPTAGDGEAGPSIVYQNIGFSTDMRAWVLDKKLIKISANIEDSSVHAGEDGGPPFVETRQLTVNAILTNGVPLELARAEGVTDNAGFVEVEAKILN